METRSTVIPKVIHYVWVGGKPLSPLAEHCLASWRTHLPEYELRRWDEETSPMDHHYVQAMYAQKKWAFVSDYIRFFALAREGGIYLDTDMEILKPLDEFLMEPGFVGRSKSGQIESSIIGAPAGAAFVKAALAWYDADSKYSIVETSPLVLERAMATVPDEKVTVFDYTHFHPINEGEVVTPEIRAHAYGIHHWAESWVPYAGVRKLARRLGVMGLIKRIVGKGT